MGPLWKLAHRIVKAEMSENVLSVRGDPDGEFSPSLKA